MSFAVAFAAVGLVIGFLGFRLYVRLGGMAGHVSAAERAVLAEAREYFADRVGR